MHLFFKREFTKSTNRFGFIFTFFFLALFSSLLGSGCATTSETKTNELPIQVIEQATSPTPSAQAETDQPVVTSDEPREAENIAPLAEEKLEQKNDPVITEGPPTPIVTPPQKIADPVAPKAVTPKPTPVPTVVPTPTPKIDIVPEPAPTTACCKICTKGKACGDTCISKSYTCHKGPGCACNGY